MSGSLPPIRRRWFQFGLGTLLLVITACACFAVWLRNHSVVHQRRLARARATTVLLASEHVMMGKDRPRIPAWRTMLGDEAVTCIWLKEDASPDEVTRTIALFPEAEVRCPPFWKRVAP